MNFNLKKKILLLLFIVNTFFNLFYLGNDISLFEDIRIIILDICLVLLSFIPVIFILCRKKLNHLYFLIIFLALSAFLALSIGSFILNIIGLIISFIETEKEKGSLEKILKRRPLFMSLTVIISGVAFLSVTSVFDYLKELVYGFQMLGEICASIFLFFMIMACKKGYLIYKNKGSIKDALVVSLPFIAYSLYLGSGLFMIYYLEGYPFVSIDEILSIIILYLFVGIFEDFLTRGIALNILLDKYGKTKRGIWLSVFLSSLFFGLIHFVNLVTGASFQGVLIQVIAATCVGMYFAAIYLRSGSVWAPALLHGVYDIAVSVPSFFFVKEVVDAGVEYGEAISNYSWSNVVIGVVFVLLTLFLLRKKKMNNVIAMVNDKPVQKSKREDASSYSLIGFGLGLSIFSVIMTIFSFIQTRDMAFDVYNKIIISNDYQEEYGLTYVNGVVNYDNLSDEAIVLIAMSSLDNNDLIDAEEKASDKEIVTYIDKDDIEDAIEELFNVSDKTNYVDINYSYKTYCSYEEDKYKCVTTNSDEKNNLKVYSNINSISLNGESYVEAYVYYIVEDMETGYLYADSNLKTAYRYDTNIKELSNGIEYDENSDNKEFWKAIEDNTDNMIPTYLLSFDMNDIGGLYLVSSKFINDSIDKVPLKDLSISIAYNQYTTDDNYTFNYNSNYFKVMETDNKLLLKYNEAVVLSVEVISSDDWLNKYKNLVGTNINLGNNNYYNIGDEYLIYKDNFYNIKINTNNVEFKNSLLDTISSLNFK